MISMRLPAVVAAMLVLSASWSVYEQGMQVVEAQQSVNAAIDEWARVYETLKPVNQQWQASYRDISQAQDALNVFKLLSFEQYQLIVPVDAIRIANVESLSVEQIPLELKRVCVADKAGHNLLTLKAATPDALLGGVIRFGQRQDITFDKLHYERIQGQLTAKLTNLCLLVRG